METQLHLLVADDDREIRALAVEHLKKNGYCFNLAVTVHSEP